jgi:Ca2+-binding EF-hand superfamily protein
MKFATILLSLAIALPLTAAAQRNQRMDTNGDGKISRDEWKRPADMFDKLDTNHDGYITRDEMRAGRRFDINQMDTNHDGKISKDEWKGRSQMFDRLDTNHDGFITQDEMKNRQKKNQR